MTEVIVPRHEFLARPLIAAWLAYPAGDQAAKRRRAMFAAKQWARVVLGRTSEERTDRIKGILRRWDAELDKQLLASVAFYHDLLVVEHDDYVLPANSRARLRRAAVERLGGDHARRDLYYRRQPVLALGGAIVASFPSSRELPRPDLRWLLFAKEEWAVRAVHFSGQIASRAAQKGMSEAKHLITFAFDKI